MAVKPSERAYAPCSFSHCLWSTILISTGKWSVIHFPVKNHRLLSYQDLAQAFKRYNYNSTKTSQNVSSHFQDLAQAFKRYNYNSTKTSQNVSSHSKSEILNKLKMWKRWSKLELNGWDWIILNQFWQTSWCSPQDALSVRSPTFFIDSFLKFKNQYSALAEDSA